MPEFTFLSPPVDASLVEYTRDGQTRTLQAVLDGQQPQAGADSVLNVRAFGAVGDGLTDDRAAIVSALAAWVAAAEAGSPKKLYWPPGDYKTSATIDLRTIFSARMYYGLDMEMDAGARLSPVSAALNPVMFFGPPGNGGIAFSNFRFGNITGAGTPSECLTLRSLVDSLIDIVAVGSATVGLRTTCDLTTAVYNNLIRIGAVGSCQYGIIASDSGTPPHGFQGNMVEIGHLTSNTSIGIWLLNQSTSNTFRIGSMEENGGHGVLDQAGYNIYRVNFAYGPNDKIELGTPNGRVDIEGYGVTLANTGNATGCVRDNAVSVVPVIPPLPASDVAYQNNFKRPATMTISGGVVNYIVINGVNTLQTSGSFRVPYGATVIVQYNAAPSWVWTFD